MTKTIPIEGARIDLGGRTVLEISGKRLPTGESIFYLRIPASGKHLSVYHPTPTRIATHVTHHYPSGRKLHTRRRAADLGRVVRDFLRTIAPPDDPPPRPSIYSRAGRRQWEAWLGRTMPKIVRRPSRQPIWGVRGPIRELCERAIPPGGSAGPWFFPLDDVIGLLRRRSLQPEELFMRMTEEDLSMGGIRMGLSDDFTRAVFLLEEGRLINVRTSRVGDVTELVFGALGVEDFLDVFLRSDSGRQFRDEIRSIAKQGGPPPRDTSPPEEGGDESAHASRQSVSE